MKQDEHLKKLLAKHAVAHTTDDFTDKTMQRINSFAVTRSKSFLADSFRLKNWLIALSILVIIALIATFLFLKPLQLPVQIRIELPDFIARHFYHLFILIPAFWLLVFINLYYEKRARI